MDARTRARRRAERRYVRRTVLTSAILAALLFAGICAFALQYPAMQIRSVEADIAGGEYDRALTAISRLKDRDAAARLENAARLAMAKADMTAGRYEEARKAFLALGDYDYAAAFAQDCAWYQAEALFAAKDYAGAQRQYRLIPDYPGVSDRLLEIRYIEAEETRQTDPNAAYTLFAELGDYRDSAEIARQLAVEIIGIADADAAIAAMKDMSQEEIAGRMALISGQERTRPGAVVVGGWHTLGLKRDGTVLAAGRNDDGQCDVSGWTGVMQIAAGARHSAALLSDGTVATTGSNEEHQCDVSDWKGVVEIACGDYATFARFADGTVAHTGYLDYADMDAWRGVTHISAGSYMAAGLYGSGDVYATHPSVMADNYARLQDIALTTGGAVGLTYEGRTKATFKSFPKWTDVVQLSAGSRCVLGIRVDGSVLAHFFRYTDAFEVSDIADALCVAAGGAHSAILDGQGRVHAYGSNDYGQCDVSGWQL